MKKGHLLLIDDDQAFLDVMKDVLEMEGYQFDGLTETGDFALLVHTVKPDLILLDYRMPRQDGGELCNILQYDADLRHIPVILLSAYQSEQLPLDRLHFSVFMPKPFDLWDLLACISEQLRQHVITAA